MNTVRPSESRDPGDSPAIADSAAGAHLGHDRRDARLGPEGIENRIPAYPRHHLRVGRERALEVVERAGLVAKTEALTRA
jgi:hypothetical protein